MIPIDIVIPTLKASVGEDVGKMAILTSFYDNVELVVSTDLNKEGFTKTVNVGISRTRPEADICLLNDDVYRFQPGWLVELVRALYTNPKFSIAGPSGKSRTKPMCNGTVGGYGVEVVRHLPFWCVVIKRSLLSKFGPLDERYVHYASDSKYCDIIVKAGYNCIWVKSVYLYHKGHGSGLIRKWADQDLKLYRRKHG